MSFLFKEDSQHELGIHRVIEPQGTLPQPAWKLDNTPVASYTVRSFSFTEAGVTLRPLDRRCLPWDDKADPLANRTCQFAR